MFNAIRNIIFVMTILFLQGCIADDILLKTKADYKLVGLEEHEETRLYLENILNERVDPIIDKDEKTAQEIKQHENYRERIIQTSLLKGLKAKGYYDAKIEYDDDEKDLSGTYHIDEGDVYTISNIEIKPKLFRQHINALTIEKHSVLEAAPVLKSQAEFYEAIQKDECYFNLDTSHQVILDKERKNSQSNL